ncbi:ion transporter [Candidatus Omnitrophota bacterium]
MNDNNELQQGVSLRETIQFYLIDSKTPIGKSIDIFIILLNLSVCALFVIDTYPVSVATKTLLWQIEVVSVVFFIIEYTARLYGSRNRFKYVLNIYAMIDLNAILPTVALLLLPALPEHIGIIKLFRIFRIFRIFRFLRFTADPYFFFGNISLSLLKVVRLVMTILMIFFIAAGLFWYVESPYNTQINTFGDAFYFTVVTLTTVGFGDIIPVSEPGRWVTLLMILSGIILIPLQAGQIVKEWVRYTDKEKMDCPQCGFQYHDKDASYCKSCGHALTYKRKG